MDWTTIAALILAGAGIGFLGGCWLWGGLAKESLDGWRRAIDEWEKCEAFAQDCLDRLVERERSDKKDAA